MKINMREIRDRIGEISSIITGIAVTIIVIAFAIIAIFLIIKIMQTL